MVQSPQRYAEIEKRLQQMQAELLVLASELSQARPADDCSCRPGQAASKIVDKVAELRYLLAVAEARRQISEKQSAIASLACQDLQPVVSPIRVTLVQNALPARKWLTTLLAAPLWRSRAG